MDENTPITFEELADYAIEAFAELLSELSGWAPDSCAPDWGAEDLAYMRQLRRDIRAS